MANARVIYKAHASSAWYTPPPLLELARSVLGGRIDLDPCTHASNPVRASMFLTRYDRKVSQDGAVWASMLVKLKAPDPVRTLWLNPPFGEGIAAWLAPILTCRAELERRGLELRALCIIPARVGAGWYATHTQGADLVCELHGRPRFLVRRHGAFVPAPFGARWGCALLYFGAELEQAFDLLEAHGATRYGRQRRRRRARARAPQLEHDPTQLEIPGSNVIAFRPKR